MAITTVQEDYNSYATGATPNPQFNDKQQTKTSSNKLDNPTVNQNQVIWYYEDQLKNKTDATLRVYAMPGFSYSNKSTNQQMASESVVSIPGESQEELDRDSDIGDESAADLILTGVIDSDFGFAVKNRFKDINGDPMSNLVQNVFSSIKGNAKLLSFGQDLFGDTIVGRGLGMVQSAANLGLLSMTDLYRIFEETSVDIPNFTVKTTLYANDTGDGSPTVKQRVKMILDRVIGRISPVEEATYGGSNGVQFGDTAKDVFGGFFSWQTPPNGYKAKLKRDDPSVGTFYVEYGNLYKVDDLIPTNIEINMSKYRLKTKNNSATTFEPLYAEVSLTLEPSIKYLKTELYKFLKLNV